jgi:hypothetical protein
MPTVHIALEEGFVNDAVSIAICIHDCGRHPGAQGLERAFPLRLNAWPLACRSVPDAAEDGAMLPKTGGSQ